MYSDWLLSSENVRLENIMTMNKTIVRNV